jgi:antitoxin MazE
MSTRVRSRLVPIGNSRGIRIPKTMLEQCHLTEDVELVIEGEILTVHPAPKTRQTWEAASRQMAEQGGEQVVSAVQAIEWDPGCREMPVKRFEVYQAGNDSRVSPYLIISPDELNIPLAVVLAAPLDEAAGEAPYRLAVHLDGQSWLAAFDRLQPLGKKNLLQKLGELDKPAQEKVQKLLAEMFA